MIICFLPVIWYQVFLSNTNDFHNRKPPNNYSHSITIIICLLTVICSSCILALDRSVNQRFPKQDAPVKISESSYMVHRKCVDVMKWYMQMPTRGSQSVWVLESQLSVKESTTMRQRLIVGLRLSTSRQKSRRNAMWGLEDNITRYGQKRKFWSIWSVFLSHTTEPLTPRRIKRVIFI